jgi:hypothetical protein
MAILTLLYFPYKDNTDITTYWQWPSYIPFKGRSSVVVRTFFMTILTLLNVKLFLRDR